MASRSAIEARSRLEFRKMRKSLWITPLVLLFAAIGASSAQADTVYTYTGNAYNACDGSPYSSPSISLPTPGTCGPYALSITFDVAAPLDDLTSLTNIDALVTTFTITDGAGFTINQSNWTEYYFSVATDATGDITEWLIDGQAPIPNTPLIYAAGSSSAEFACALPIPSDTECYDEALILAGSRLTNDYAESYASGTWAPPVTTTPEPPSYLLLGMGLLGLLALAGRTKRLTPSASF
ncbi:MAG: PEP-CTERM sorting domain-containing protein [Candidatus Acidiferrales bacterium]